MLLEFRAKNFKTFADELVFSMIPAPKIRDIKYSVLNQKIANREYRALSSAVIYGPNAAGKTNIVSAMEVLKSIVLIGNIENESRVFSTPNEAVRKLELIPNTKSIHITNVELGIMFIEKNILFEYSIILDIGKFLNKEYDRKIIAEKLLVNSKMIFNRCDTVEIGDVSIINEYLINDFNPTVSEKIAKSNLDARELFLTNMFKSVFSKKLTEIITGWFMNKLMCIYQSNNMAIVPLFANEDSKGIAMMDETVLEAIKHFGINANDIAYVPVDEKRKAEPCSMIQISKDKYIAVPVEIYESYGTERFLNIFPLIMRALETGATLVIDEFDASIHPMALMSIIGVFHNDEINKNKAQLIFNTHNPIFLNKNLFRRDEIKFVERDDETGCSNHYSLSDFKTSGPSGVRNTDDYMKSYFINQYGAIRNIDFSEILQNAILEASEGEA